MSKKLIACLAVLAVVVTVVPALAALVAPTSPKATDCCYPGSECCYPGSPCCEAGCCYEGSPCCITGADCCTIPVSAAVPEAAKKGCCKADAGKAGGCCGKGCCSKADAKKGDEKKLKDGHCGKCEMCFAKAADKADIVPADATVIAVEGMDCPSCAKKVVAKLGEVAGVEKAVADVKASKLTVTPKAKAAPSAKAMWEAVEKAGYKPTKLEGPAGKFAASPKE